jgi:hypothetical protein
VPGWGDERRGWRSVEEQKRDRDQRYRDERAEAAKDYLADIAGEGPDFED